MSVSDLPYLSQFHGAEIYWWVEPLLCQRSTLSDLVWVYIVYGKWARCTLVELHLYILIHSPKWVTIHGVTYKKSAVMVVSPATTFEEPTFGKIQEVFVINRKDVYLYVQIMDTEDYSHHFAAYVVRQSSSFKLIPFHQFVSYLPLHTHKISSFSAAVCIVPKFILK